MERETRERDESERERELQTDRERCDEAPLHYLIALSARVSERLMVGACTHLGKLTSALACRLKASAWLSARRGKGSARGKGQLCAWLSTE